MSRIISVPLLSTLAIGCGQAATDSSSPVAIESGEAEATVQLISLNLPGMT